MISAASRRAPKMLIKPPVKPSLYVPGRLQEQVQLHLLCNLANQPVPLMMAINGPPGEGKTFSVSLIAKRLGLNLYRLPGGSFDNPLAGEPVRELRRLYLRAGQWMRSQPLQGSMLLLDDLDLVLGELTPGVQRTINSPLLISELMHLADHPTRVDQEKTLRVPIIITGNHLGSLHEPLRRSGRMKWLEWKLNPAEKLEAIGRIFPGREDDCWALMDAFGEESLAFFNELKETDRERRLLTVLRSWPLQQAVQMARSGRFQPVEGPSSDLATLLALGRAILSQRQPLNHLKVGDSP
jgi:SpoVK/Ycf46/Vps4 family AAA+-type ATPase